MLAISINLPSKLPPSVSGSFRYNPVNSFRLLDNWASALVAFQVNYPEQVLNLITTMTNAISKARNSFSDSHFDGESDKWLGEFARDCVNSIGRLIIKFIK